MLPDSKATNPKDALGSARLPLELVPDTMETFASIAFLEGALKYGRFNWRVAGVRASIYRAAIERHLNKWWNGEDVDPETGVPHLASVLASAGIILDAMVQGKLTDDRPPRQADYGELLRDLEANVARLKSLFSDRNPQQYQLGDE